MNIASGANKIFIEVIKEEASGEMCLRDIYSGVSDKWYGKLSKEH